MTKPVVKVDFKKLKAHADANRWTGPAISRKSGVSTAAVNFIFRGKIKDPGATVLKRICDVIDLPIEEAFYTPKRKTA